MPISRTSRRTGSSLLVSEGQLRANYHRLKPTQTMSPETANLRVRPELPLHGYAQAAFDPAPLADSFEPSPTLRRDTAPLWHVHRGAPGSRR